MNDLFGPSNYFNDNARAPINCQFLDFLPSSGPSYGGDSYDHDLGQSDYQNNQSEVSISYGTNNSNVSYGHQVNNQQPNYNQNFNQQHHQQHHHQQQQQDQYGDQHAFKGTVFLFSSGNTMNISELGRKQTIRAECRRSCVKADDLFGTKQPIFGLKQTILKTLTPISSP